METFETSSDIINRFLFEDCDRPDEPLLAFFVHPSIRNKWEKVMSKKFTNSDWEMYEQILQIGSKQFEMRLVIVLRANKDQYRFLCDLVNNSQFSFPWEQIPTIFIDAAKFNIMEEFIKYFNLQAYILKIEEKLGYHVSTDHPIKVVSFNQSVSAKLDIIYEYEKYWYGSKKGYLFMAYGFPWHQSYCLQKSFLNDDFYSILPIILRHLGTLSYGNDLDILDLLSLRLAISDVRDPSKSNLLKYEIDFLIKRVLAKLIKNNHLSINEYLVAKNRKPSGFLIVYLVYEFKMYFETLDIDGNYVNHQNSIIPLRDTIILKEEIDVLNKLKERFNVEYHIDGKGFDKMTLSLFVGLIESQNVYAIELDTNYSWQNNSFMAKHNTIISGYKEAVVDIYLRGENIYNFIEALAAEIKTITFDNNKIILHIYCKLNDYRIFDNLTVFKIIFEEIKIDFNMLENLQHCDIKPSMSLDRCFLQNSSHNWELLNNIEKLQEATIYEDEGTWLSMFKFIMKVIHKTKSNEFQFNSKRLFEILLPGNLGSIDLQAIKFTLDEQNSKLEILQLDTNEIVDLYCKKCNIQEEEKPDYEFYE